MPRQSRSGEDRYRYYMELCQTDPEAAGQEFLAELKKSRKPAALKTARQLEQMLAGDESVWQRGSRNLTDAIQFIISNAFLSSQGMSVLRPDTEDITKTVAAIITEDTSFKPLTTTQQRLKTIAESYGFIVY